MQVLFLYPLLDSVLKLLDASITHHHAHSGTKGIKKKTLLELNAGGNKKSQLSTCHSGVKVIYLGIPFVYWQKISKM